MTHVQTELPEEEYERLQALAEERGLSIREALREAAELWIEECDAVDPEDPLFASVESVRDANRDRSAMTVTEEDDPVEDWAGDASDYRCGSPEDEG